MQYGACALRTGHVRLHAHTQQYVILIAFPLQRWLCERASMSRYTYGACLVYCNTFSSQSQVMWHKGRIVFLFVSWYGMSVTSSVTSFMFSCLVTSRPWRYLRTRRANIVFRVFALHSNASSSSTITIRGWQWMYGEIICRTINNFNARVDEGDYLPPRKLIPSATQALSECLTFWRKNYYLF